RSIEAEVDPQPQIALGLEEHLLADGLDADGLATAQNLSAFGEAALRARCLQRLADEVAIELPGDPVYGVSLGHVRRGGRAGAFRRARSRRSDRCDGRAAPHRRTGSR